MKYVLATILSLAVGWFTSEAVQLGTFLSIFLSSATFGLAVLWLDGQLGD